MRVTPHTRHLALHRLFHALELERAGDGVPFHRLDRLWSPSCGLRRNDLIETLAEWTRDGRLRVGLGGDGTIYTRTADAGPPPAAAFATRLHSEWTLLRARMRSLRLLRRGPTLVVDRRLRP